MSDDMISTIAEQSDHIAILESALEKIATEDDGLPTYTPQAMVEIAKRALLSRTLATPQAPVAHVEGDGRDLAHQLADIARSLLSRPPELRGPFAVDEESLRRVAALPPRSSKPKVDVRQVASTPPPPANAGEREGWRSIPVTDETVEYVSRYGGRCRDCADNFGTCPGTNLPCVPAEANKAIRHVLNAINYGFEHGFLPIPAKEG